MHKKERRWVTFYCKSIFLKCDTGCNCITANAHVQDYLLYHHLLASQLSPVSYKKNPSLYDPIIPKCNSDVYVTLCTIKVAQALIKWLLQW